MATYTHACVGFANYPFMDLPPKNTLHCNLFLFDKFYKVSLHLRKLDKLTEEFPDSYKRISRTEMDSTYSLPKSYISYRKPRKLNEEQREQARQMMIAKNRERKE